ncbi:NAD(P)/FAD-dependent oxidoreductase [Seongchinamella sediminis]|uniref:Ferredoxin--NADP reductase n=1 Tax=Seongchinamella sediminis TaxID=2283635 RepID=A0A3L7DVW8_9GAMM|nr:NAD(P)/FAD-dependent oxidoreductase [Seongchinamella sediminis]RLQ20689.1 NAD(P)/FAD-dependent oxidoreductase [Seongchinamella sediminis]
MAQQNPTASADVGVIGAGPCGLFQVFELGLQGLSALVFDAQNRSGGQCRQLYPGKPIYDIPGIPEISAEQLIANLEQQISPFEPQLVLGHEVVNIERQPENSGFHLTTADGRCYAVRFIVIASGAGAMTPVPLRVAGMERFLGRSLFYHVEDPEQHRDRVIAVLGGGDAALDWALALQPVAAEIILIHRSGRLRAAADSQRRYTALCENSSAQQMQGQVSGYEQNAAGELSALKVQCADGVVRRVAVDQVLVFFGMSPDILSLRDWQLDMERFQVKVGTDTFETSSEGIFAIGDCNHYPGKRKLILSGFHEAALAAFAISERMQDGKPVPMEYTTTSPTLQKRLGVTVS